MTSNTLYLLQFKNYYNREIAVDYTLGLYLEHVVRMVEGYNFNPNDGISTTVLVNDEFFNQHYVPDYLVVCNEDNEIVSRWWILEEQRTRGGQWLYTLYRDTIADNWYSILKSPCLIEKCNLNRDDPLIFNNEDMTFNQIKKSETLLKDNSDCPWLVGYLAKGEVYRGTVSHNAFSELDILPPEAWAQFNQYVQGYENPNIFYGKYHSLKYQIYYGNGYLNIDYQDARNIKFYDNNTNSSGLSLNTGELSRDKIQYGIYNGFNSKLTEMFRQVPAYATGINDDDEIFDFISLNGALVQDGAGRVYKVKVVEVEASKDFTYNVQAGSLYNTMAQGVSDSIYNSYGVQIPSFNGSPNQYSFKVKANYAGYQLQLEEQLDLETSYDISQARITTTDATYDIIAIPYGKIKVSGVGLSEELETNADLAIKTITSISRNETTSKVYDIQLLPYCPVQDLIDEKGTLKVTNAAQYSTITAGQQNVVGVIFNVPNANFSLNIEKSISAAVTNIECKINNECDKWRLVSPNYSNYFDFNLEKNNGVNYFNVDCSYKPFSPYIHINPDFNGLYGADFNDPRGLICGGDFSLSQVQDAWQQYELQNKNFQATFDRQIQNMEVNNKYQRINDIVGATVGTMQGGVMGGTMGASMSGGNPAATAAGAIAGTVASAIGGASDVVIKEKLRNETLDYTKDMFGYQLGNIQALPLTLSKVSAFNTNNKIFPVLEYYTATDREKEALANKLAYNGMTTMVIGTIEDNIGNTWTYEINDKVIESKQYIKAKPIRFEYLYDEYHMANTIAKELDMGFYIYEET